MSTLKDTIPSLLAKTQEKKIEWEDIGGGGSFIARFGNLSLELRKTRDDVPILSLLDENGRRIETVDWSLLERPLDQQLEALYEQARRKALRVEDKIIDLRNKLDEL